MRLFKGASMSPQKNAPQCVQNAAENLYQKVEFLFYEIVAANTYACAHEIDDEIVDALNSGGVSRIAAAVQRATRDSCMLTLCRAMDRGSKWSLHKVFSYDRSVVSLCVKGESNERLYDRALNEWARRDSWPTSHGIRSMIADISIHLNGGCILDTPQFEGTLPDLMKRLRDSILAHNDRDEFTVKPSNVYPGDVRTVLNRLTKIVSDLAEATGLDTAPLKEVCTNGDEQSRAFWERFVRPEG